MKRAVEKLSTQQRQVIELAYFEGLSQTEMAERMGQPLGTVKTWVRTALKNSARRTGRGGGVGMNCTELRDHYELYALGLAEEPERGEIRGAPGSRMRGMYGGDEASAGDHGGPVGRLGRARGAFPQTAAPYPGVPSASNSAASDGRHSLPAPPSCALRRGILFRRPRMGFLQPGAPAAGQSRAQIIELTRLNEAFAILNGADTTVTSFGEKKPTPKGRLFCNPRWVCC